MATKTTTKRTTQGTSSKPAAKSRAGGGQPVAAARGKPASAGRARTAKRSGGSKGKSAAGSQTTTDHDQIREWAEARGGKPASVAGTGGGDDPGLIQIDFPGYSGGDGKLQEITWDEFFEKFDANGLALLYQEETAGGEQSNFNKLVGRRTAAAKSGGGRAGKAGGAKAAGGRSSRAAEPKTSAAGKRATGPKRAAAAKKAAGQKPAAKARGGR